MILKIFAVRDMKAEAFLQPFFSPSVGSALRAFSDAVNDKNCPFNKHPDDYVLYEIGTYNDQTAWIEAMQIIKMYTNAIDLLELKPKFGEMQDDVKIANKIAIEMAENGKK